MAQSDAAEKTRSVSDPNSPDYDPDSPHYDVTADSSSQYYVGPVTGDHKSGDEIRAEVTSVVDGVLGSWLGPVFVPIKDGVTQSVYTARIEAERERLIDGMDLRTPGEAPRTMWENASHEQMVEIISSNADSAAVAVTSEEWVRLGNELTEHQKAFGAAINDSLSNWEGEAGDAARTHLAEVAKWLGTTATGAALTGRQQEIHSQTLNETQKAMAANPPVPFSAAEANNRLATITNPVQFAMQFAVEMETYHQHVAARDQAAQVMNRFDETIAGAATTPRFTAPPTLAQATMASTVSRPVDHLDGEPNAMKARGRFDANAAGPGGDPTNQAGGSGAVPDIPGGQGASGGGSVPGIPGGGGPGGGAVPGIPGGGGAGGGAIPGIPGGGGPGGGAVPGIPGGGGAGGGAIPGIPGGGAVPGIPGGGVPGGGSLAGIPGGGGPGGGGAVPGISGGNMPAAARIPTSQSGFVPDIPGGGGSTGASGFTPPSVPDLPRTNVPGGSNLASGSGFTPPPIPGGSMPGGSQQNRPNVPNIGSQQNRPIVPNLPGGGQVGGGSLGGGGGGRFGVPDIPGGGTGPGGTSMGGGARGFGPSGGGMGGGGAGMPGGGAGMPGGGASGGAGAGGRWGPVGGGASMGAGAMPDEAMGRGGAQAGPAGARGANAQGMPMGGGMGGAGSQRDEDKEYRVAEYLEGDSELFAPDAVVHPPVIGDWANKQDWK